MVLASLNGVVSRDGKVLSDLRDKIIVLVDETWLFRELEGVILGWAARWIIIDCLSAKSTTLLVEFHKIIIDKHCVPFSGASLRGETRHVHATASLAACLDGSSASP